MVILLPPEAHGETIPITGRPSMPTPRFPFPKSDHLRRPGDFQATYAQRVVFRCAPFALFARPNGLSHLRIGWSISRKHGGAVQRNRKKRLFREAFRAVRPSLGGGLDLIVVPNTGVPIVLAELRDLFPQALRKLRKRLEQRTAQPANPTMPASSRPPSPTSHPTESAKPEPAKPESARPESASPLATDP
jgi:ribonuclease P protein component